MSKFQNGDMVTTRTGPGLGDQPVVGRVVGFHNPSGANNPAHEFYMILLQTPLEGYPWSAIMLSGTMLDKLTVLDEMARDEQRECPWCGEGS